MMNKESIDIQKIQKDAIKYLDLLRSNREKDIINLYKDSLSNVREELIRLYAKLGIESKSASIYRLKNLRSQIKAELIKIQTASQLKMESTFVDMYRESYLYNGFAMTNTINLPLTFGIFNPKAIESFLDKSTLYKIKWDKRNIRNINKIGKSIELVLKGIRSEISNGLIEGSGYVKTANKITDKFSVMKNKAITIVRTESHRAQVLGSLTSMDDADDTIDDLDLDIKISRVWDSTLDARTRPDHQKMDGKVADEKGMFLYNGKKVKAPASITGFGEKGNARANINCRCSVRQEVTGEDLEPPKYKYKNYEDWRKTQK